MSHLAFTLEVMGDLRPPYLAMTPYDTNDTKDVVQP